MRARDVRICQPWCPLLSFPPSLFPLLSLPPSIPPSPPSSLSRPLSLPLAPPPQTNISHPRAEAEEWSGGRGIAAIAMWTATGDEDHVWIVGSYFHYSVPGGFTPPEARDITPAVRGGSDPMYVVFAHKTAPEPKPSET